MPENGHVDAGPPRTSLGKVGMDVFSIHWEVGKDGLIANGHEQTATALRQEKKSEMDG